MGREIGTARLALALLGAVAPSPALAQPAPAPVAEGSAQARLALAREIVDLGMPPATREEVFFRVVDQMSSQARDAMMRSFQIDDPDAVAILDRWLDRYNKESLPVLRRHIPALMEGWAAAYADIYSERELTDIRAFIATPSGAAFFRKSQDVLGNPKFAAVNQAYMNEVLGGLPQAQEELVAELKAHFEKQSASD